MTSTNDTPICQTIIHNAQLDWNDAGTPVSDQFDDVYFSNVNGLEETRYVFLQQNHLPERWHTFRQRRFVIGETGFGTGLNFLAVWQWFEQFRFENPDSALQELHFISFEKFPLSKDDLIKAHQAWPELGKYAAELQKHYPLALPDCHRIILADGAITLDLWFGDIKDCMPQVPVNESGIIDAWFLDGFAPSKNPEMWNQILFNSMAKLAKKACTCATFTAAGFVRRGLIEAGFDMKKTKGFGTKRDMIVGTLAEKVPFTNIAPWYARPENDDIHDVAIIGGGIASATLASALCRRGVAVTLYCSDEAPAENASGNRQGAVYPLLNGTHSGLSRLFAPAFLFARQVIQQASEQLEFAHQWCGVTQLAWDDKAEKKLDKMLEGNFPEPLIHKLTAEQTALTIGLPVTTESVHYPLGGWLCPKELTQAMITRLTKLAHFSAHFNTGIETLTFDTEVQLWKLSTQDKIFNHQAVVVANGHKFNQFEQTQSIPASAVKGQVSHIPTTPSLTKLKTVLCYDGYMTPNNPDDGLHCIGASFDREHINQTFDPQAQCDNKTKLLRSVTDQSWPNEVDVSGNDSRQGIRCATRDHVPYVGNVCDLDKILHNYADLHRQQDNAETIADYPNLFCIIGLGSRGLCSAPLMAEALASQMCNDPLPLPVAVLDNIHPGRMWVRRLLKGKAIVQ
ncbi:bifunctional tRNA (5-methylaminomethyl-2-thiouridine)(34)-methyltransferase MnmD/FAD-dependent 5-carboxymethylaminomethyl-2-thiouridine(34) oxidoreductase MnmC [Vibrio sp. HA2012]|uniref:bifunctional tRNA (5-methylaminomethyl-2-thiouridine)(34)-methyltransferase MnmD/FAD-dependent 5-carboxymethylaminomethyl-2-thiouridine(34) oxidoreductase MnmC n=1 Tax=Vibrio sp. HA2012 TaxID=1971595 RepID=UPI000C2CC003|nr:bifunctional tRNA (5-methylaminomethyl-2-thiouridine)(34)-methyltransferase MnmD/FAD-dependent 5-carboxymethylaminomethyl-2-thiouridine(34) oxidoreductase MnmC [Vibrio sp. HA2012]PJC88234.1 bifunctional tRNA (5-methylaminomethyl-2-thiouridine)(34)-methyltransferase MnmD/FAD-dependent 5-carboxymethylaminomethyl-2-thiouridine(34) oxidoreductase MnmC [Vibrio sp. HA2012]